MATADKSIWSRSKPIGISTDFKLKIGGKAIKQVKFAEESESSEMPTENNEQFDPAIPGLQIIHEIDDTNSDTRDTDTHFPGEIETETETEEYEEEEKEA